MSFKLVLVSLLVVCAAYVLTRLSIAELTGKSIVQQTQPFTRATGTRSLLVLGDSTAYGVGASSPEFSVPGRLSAELNLSVENNSRSGALTREMVEQLSRSTQKRYDMVLLQVGANDVIFQKSLTKAEVSLREALVLAREKSDRVVLLTAGDIGSAEVFFWPLSTLMTYRTELLRTKFMRVSEELGVVYVDIYAYPDAFASDPKKYYAADGLHLSDSGYDFWFGIVLEYVQKKWPEFTETPRS